MNTALVNRQDSARFGDAADTVADFIRSRILAGELPAGAQLKQQLVARELGVSHIPVREAFKVLEAEGFVVCRPRHGAFVAGLSRANAIETWELRAQLEPLAVWHSVPRVTQADLADAKALMKEASRTPDHVTWMRLNWAFHRRLYAAANRPMLMEIIHDLWHNVDRYCTLLSRAHGKRHVLCDHAELWSAYKAQDVNRAQALVLEHMKLVENRVLELLDHTPTTVD